jgi:hypothetical protein
MHDRQQSRSRSNMGDRNHPTTSRSILAHIATLSMFLAFLPQGCTAHTPWLPTAEIDQERDVACAMQAPTSLDGGEFQKARICISPNNQRSTRWRVLVVSANDPPRVDATDSEEARRIQANATAPGGGRRSSARRYPYVPATCTSSSKRRGSRHSIVPRPTWVRR